MLKLSTVKQIISRRQKDKNVFKMLTLFVFWKHEKCRCKACAIKLWVFHYLLCKFVIFLSTSSSWFLQLLKTTWRKLHNTKQKEKTNRKQNQFQFTHFAHRLQLSREKYTTPTDNNYLQSHKHVPFWLIKEFRVDQRITNFQPDKLWGGMVKWRRLCWMHPKYQGIGRLNNDDGAGKKNVTWK